jgi:rubrerythrin
MNFDVYNCDECIKAFAVEADEEPNCCPTCESGSWEYSHSIHGVTKESNA